MITEEEVQKSLQIIKAAVDELPTLKGKKEDEVIPPPEKGVEIKVDN